MISGKPTDERLLVSDINPFERGDRSGRDLGPLTEPAREIPVYRQSRHEDAVPGPGHQAR
jgi:hypothetical protein